MFEIPITKDFNDKEIIGYVTFTPKFKKEYEENLEMSGPNSDNIWVLSPAYISDFPDEDGVIHTAELIGLGVIPAYRAVNKRTKK